MTKIGASKATAAARILQPLVIVLKQRGIEVGAFLARFDLSEHCLNESFKRIPEPVVRDLWLEAVRITNDPTLGLKVGRRADPLAFGVIGYVLSNAATVGQAFQLLERFNRLIFDETLLYPQRNAEGLGILQFRRDPTTAPELNRPTVEYLMAALLRLSGFLVGGEDLGPQYLKRLNFRFAEPDAQILAQYREAFGSADLVFSCPDTSITFSAEFLNLPVAYSDPQMLELMKNQADRQLRALAKEGDLVERVRESIRRRLLGKAPSVVAVAADCGFSRATLQRRLADVGSSFQCLLDRVRYDMACELLNETESSLNEIAFMLGYAEVSAFHHAFRRWSGVTPGAYRQSAD